MSFVPRRNRVPNGIAYQVQGVGYGVGVGPDTVVFALSGAERGRSPQLSAADALASVRPDTTKSRAQAVVRMRLVGADRVAQPVVGARLPGTANYLMGSDPVAWERGLPTYGQVGYRGVYPGVDVVYHGNQGNFEYDFIVAPGADPSRVEIAFEGVEGVSVDADGELVTTVAGAELRQQAPVIYQGEGEAKVAVPGGFVVRNGNVAFAVGPYDRTRPLVIDPRVDYSTFLGAMGTQFGLNVAVDRLGQAYVVGATTAGDYPATPGAFDTSFNGYPQDGFVAKLSRDGKLLYSTFLGGSGRDDTDSVAVGVRGDAYVRGITFSTNFPTTPGAFDRTFNGSIDAYVARLSPDGSSLVFSTFLGGSGFDSGSGIALDVRGAIYVPGITGSPGFPTTPGAYERTFHGVGGPAPPPFGPGDWDAYLTKLRPDGSGLEYSTFLGGGALEAGFGVAVDARGDAYVAGVTLSADFPTTPGAYDTTLGGPYDAFVAKFNRDGSALLYSTFVGGSGPEGTLGLAIDRRGSAYITGGTPSADFPTTRGALDRTFNGWSDVFVTKLAPDGSGLVFSTFVGGADFDDSSEVAVDDAGEAYVTGTTGSADFPTTVDAWDATVGGGSDAFLVKLGREGTDLAYSTYLGGSGSDYGSGVAVDGRGAAYVTGGTESIDFPTTPGALDPTWNGGSDAFAIKISPAGGPASSS